MLFMGSIDFYISTIVASPDGDRIQNAINSFEEILNQVRKDERFKYAIFILDRIRRPTNRSFRSEEELAKMKKEMEKNGYTVTKKREQKKNEQEVCHLRWRSSMPPDMIRAFIDKWNEIDNKPLSVYTLRYSNGALGMI